jgi:hypothetical protein
MNQTAVLFYITYVTLQSLVDLTHRLDCTASCVLYLWNYNPTLFLSALYRIQKCEK